MSRYLVVGLGGFVGAIARYAIGVWVETFWRRDFPLATFLINVTGCFIIGFVLTAVAERAPIDPLWRLLIATGFVGAYTTFSTFEWETHRLTESGALGWALANVLASILIGFVAVRLGVQLGRR